MQTRLIRLLTSVPFVLLEPVVAVAQQNQQSSGPSGAWNCAGPWHMGGGWAFWWMFPLLMIVICVGIFFLGRASHGHHHWGPVWGPDRSWGDPTHSALQLLNERYARGEIQKEEYEERKAAILSTRQR